MDTPEYTRIPYEVFQDNIKLRHYLKEKVSRDFIYVRIKQGMYGLKQAAILTYKQLVKHLKTSGYYPVTGTNEIFTHKTRKKFYLCVYIFWDKYHSTYDADHILNVLKEKHDMINDGEGKN